MRVRNGKLLAFEVGQVIFIAVAGSLLHFAFELADYWKPLAWFAAVNESAWEHTKMYFWPGLAYALAQYTYTRGIANNYWFGKAMALLVTPVSIFVLYFGYLSWSMADGGKPTLAIMLTIMLLGISAGQAVSYYILTAPPMASGIGRYASATYALLLVLFSTLTYFPPKLPLFENFYCYQYTGDYGILPDYEPYRVFTRDTNAGGGVNYCATLSQQAVDAR